MGTPPAVDAGGTEVRAAPAAAGVRTKPEHRDWMGHPHSSLSLPSPLAVYGMESSSWWGMEQFDTQLLARPLFHTYKRTKTAFQTPIVHGNGFSLH